MMERAASLPADEAFFDLEDSVAPDRKAASRELVVEALLRFPADGRRVGVRVNAVGSGWFQDDVAVVVGRAGNRADFLVVPKVDTPAEVEAVERALARAEADGGVERAIGLELQIESATGLTNVDAVAAASTRTEALVFGPADMAASLGMPALSAGAPLAGYPGDHYHYVMMRILVAARAAGLQAIDGPHLLIEDLDGLREGAMRARALGYDGKWAVHPTQIEVLNEVFAPTAEEFERARAILAAQAGSVAGGRGASRFGAEMIDEASRRMAERMVARGRAAGMGGEGPAGD